MGDTGVMGNIKSMAYLGIAGKQDDEYVNFVRLFRRFNNTADRLSVDSSLVCYYSEFAGIPLMYINDLDKYRQSYLEIAKKPGSGLHIERLDEKYTDILLKTDSEIAVLREAIRILLTSTILGVVEVFVDRDERLGYKYVRTGTQALPLGSEYMAIEMIRANFNLRSELDHKVTDMVSNFDHAKLIQYYTIIDYYTNELFKPRFYKVGHSIEEKRTHENRALTPVQEELRNSLLTTMPEADFDKQYSDAKSKIDDFSALIGDRRVLKK
jgi:hypothetical protein